MNFDNYSIRPILEQDALLFFHLIDDNRARIVDFFAGLVTPKIKLVKQSYFMPTHWREFGSIALCGS
jgi:hypothetical protein